jgi:putative membrane protein
MHILALLLVGLVASIHAYILVLEMFLWTKPYGLKIFRQSFDKAQSSAPLAMNQGLYNGFLSAGLLWGLFNPNAEVSRQFEFFFLGCVIFAGVLGAWTVNRRIFFIQSLPAILAGGLLAISS